MKTNKELLDENRKLRSSNTRLRSEVKKFRQEKKDKEKRAVWQDQAHALTKRLYPE